MARTYNTTIGGGPAARRPASAEAEAAFRAKVRALRAIRSGTPAGGSGVEQPAAFEPARPAIRPWAF